MILAIMGVCGSGKTIIAENLSEKLKWSIAEADDYHPQSNRTKMAAGIPLNDQDRVPWLMSLHTVIQEWIANGTDGIVTCSALKRKYRNILIYGQETPTNESSDKFDKILFVHLNGTKDEILQRMQSRSGHFMPSSLLESQLQALEMPTENENAFIVDIDADVKTLTEQILKYLHTRYRIMSQ